MFRVWRKTYNGFEEIEAKNPQEAIKATIAFDESTGDFTTYTYEVEVE